MKFQGPGEHSIHQTQLSVTASMLRDGVALEEIAAIVLAATRAAVDGNPQVKDIFRKLVMSVRPEHFRPGD